MLEEVAALSDARFGVEQDELPERQVDRLRRRSRARSSGGADQNFVQASEHALDGARGAGAGYEFAIHIQTRARAGVEHVLEGVDSGVVNEVGTVGGHGGLTPVLEVPTASGFQAGDES